MLKKLAIALVAISLLLTGCNSTTTMTDFDQLSGPQDGDTVVTMSTSMGDIKIRLFADLVPEITKNFVTLSEDGYYDGLTFHRVINGFMIQGGDPNGNGTGGHSYKGEGTILNDEIASELSHVRGALSMANRGPNTNGSQFFIVQSDSAFLDGGYSLFGQVYEGMDVVDSISSVEKDSRDMPLEPVIIETVKVETK